MFPLKYGGGANTHTGTLLTITPPKRRLLGLLWGGEGALSASYTLRRPNDWATCLCFLSKQETQRININKAQDEKGKEPRTSGGAVKPQGLLGAGGCASRFTHSTFQSNLEGWGLLLPPPTPTSPEAQARASPSQLCFGPTPPPPATQSCQRPQGLYLWAGGGQSLRLWAHVGRLPRCWGPSSQPGPSWTTARCRASVSSFAKWVNSPNLAGKE